MKKIILTATIISSFIIAFVMMNGCASTKLVDKGSAELWSENCIRCHSIPPPNSFTSEQWETIGMHMRVRAGLTDDEIKKITEFLQSATN